MCGVRVRVVMEGVHDVMDSCGEVWNGDGRCFVPYGCVGRGREGTVPGAMMIKVRNRGKGRGVNELTSNPVQEACK